MQLIVHLAVVATSNRASAEERQRIDENVAAMPRTFHRARGEQQCQDRQPTTITTSVVSVERKPPLPEVLL